MCVCGQVIPQYSIMPDSSQSNVVVEPSGFLEITDYTSQRLDEEAAMEQEVDSSNDEGAATSPVADQSQWSVRIWLVQRRKSFCLCFITAV